MYFFNSMVTTFADMGSHLKAYQGKKHIFRRNLNEVSRFSLNLGYSDHYT